MGENSAIAWTDHTHNEWVGCTKVSTGPLGLCEACYAESYDNRWGGGHWGPGAPRKRTSEANRRRPMLWNRKAEKIRIPAKVFAHSLSDVFDNEVPQEWRNAEYETWWATPWLRWIVLTKRPGNIAKMLPNDWGMGYPNVGFVCSVGTQAELDRDLPKILDVPARWHGLSIEPQLEAVDLSLCTRRSLGKNFWVICGGESAQPRHTPRPYNIEWARSLIRQCRAAEIPCFVKQLGSNPCDFSFVPSTIKLRHRTGADPSEWPQDIRVREFPEALR